MIFLPFRNNSWTPMSVWIQFQCWCSLVCCKLMLIIFTQTFLDKLDSKQEMLSTNRRGEKDDNSERKRWGTGNLWVIESPPTLLGSTDRHTEPRAPCGFVWRSVCGTTLEIWETINNTPHHRHSPPSLLDQASCLPPPLSPIIYPCKCEGIKSKYNIATLIPRCMQFQHRYHPLDSDTL